LAQSNIKCEVNKYYGRTTIDINPEQQSHFKIYVNKHNIFNIKIKNIMNEIDNSLFNLKNNQELKKLGIINWDITTTIN